VATALRCELYPGLAYDDIPWSAHLQSVAEIDNYSPIHWLMQFLQWSLTFYERLGPISFLRRASLKYAEAYMKAEDEETNFLTIGPVSKSLHMVCAWVLAGGQQDVNCKSDAVEAHIARVPAYLWVAEDGMKMQGYNGSMIWDTSFAIQAVIEAGLVDEFPQACERALGFFSREQVQKLRQGDWRYWRQPICGGWGFSTAEQAWPVSDTSAEALKTVLGLHASAKPGWDLMPDANLFDAVEFLLSYQNPDGGWATYENTRGHAWYELMNPSEVFGDIMIDYSYVECSASAMSALAKFTQQHPTHRALEIKRAIARGANLISTMQRADGSWYGCWGCCFTYGCWFGIEGLLAAGRSVSCKEISGCVKFLLSVQGHDGGWSEDFASCYNREYTPSPQGSDAVMTSWALLGLMAAECEDVAAVRRGIEVLLSKQLPSGDWPQEGVSGVFNRSVGITYTSFRNVFPIWALGRFARAYEPRHCKRS